MWVVYTVNGRVNAFFGVVGGGRFNLMMVVGWVGQLNLMTSLSLIG